jgi:hypothetical protein
MKMEEELDSNQIPLLLLPFPWPHWLWNFYSPLRFSLRERGRDGTEGAIDYGKIEGDGEAERVWTQTHSELRRFFCFSCFPFAILLSLRYHDFAKAFTPDFMSFVK